MNRWISPLNRVQIDHKTDDTSSDSGRFRLSASGAVDCRAGESVKAVAGVVTAVADWSELDVSEDLRSVPATGTPTMHRLKFSKPFLPTSFWILSLTGLRLTLG